MGLSPVANGKGLQFTGGSGGQGLDSRVADVRVMDPVTTGKYPYPDGYVTYGNAADGQPLDWPDGFERRSFGAPVMEPEVTIDELLRSPERRDYAAMPETDALTKVDGLQEAALLDARFDVAGSFLAVLFDLRTALQFRMSNTAVLVMHEVAQVRWIADKGRGPRRVAHYMVSSKPGIQGDRSTLEVQSLRGWRLSAVASSAEFFVGDVPDLPAAPANFVEDSDQAIAAGMPAWGSMFKPEWATFLDPMSPQPG